ncbi:MAG: deoxyribodipyrimidine photo-lyase [bacterium]|nr:deoxyribodipyrimidine photo-lyase [bacterium]
MVHSTSIFWFRRDLRLADNAGLYHALRSGQKIIPLFIFDSTILNKLENKKDLRVQFIHQEISKLSQELKALGSGLMVKYGEPKKIIQEILAQVNIQDIFCNKDYEPNAIKRDQAIQEIIALTGGKFHSFKDQSIFEQDEITKDDGKPYTIFTPYSKKWKAKLQSNIKEGTSYFLTAYSSTKYQQNFIKEFRFEPIPSLQEMGFGPSDFNYPKKEVESSVIKNYTQNRNFPAIKGTSQLGMHFRFGTISIRDKARKAAALNETFLNELIWRDFYMQILWHFPQVEQHAFKAKYERINWRNNEEEFKKWCEGKTGYPIVDAGMRELNITGFMHNRVRMIVASFLTKHLLVDWRWGEAYFAEKLLDFDLSANNGGWQWAAGCGTDAAPYFRVFNPMLQTEKFDKQFQYIKKWVPEIGSDLYPKPMVDHTFARNRCLETYKKGLD